MCLARIEGNTCSYEESRKTHHRQTYMHKQVKQTLVGFTLVEIMIVVAIIALLAAIAVPNFLRARKRSQATRMLEDLRIIDSSLDQYAIENNKGAGDPYSWTDLQKYLKQGTPLYNALFPTGTNPGGNPLDMYGHTYRSVTAAIDQEAPGIGDISLDPLTFCLPF